MARQSGKLAKAGLKMAKVVVAKTGYKAGVKIASKFAAKFAVTLGAAASKAFAKSATKIAALGPIGVAMVIFDITSLVLDLWDPAGYNDVQAAGQIKDMRDGIETYYSETLKMSGISTVLADPLSFVPPGDRGEF